MSLPLCKLPSGYKDRGFTLIEALIALVVITVGVLGGVFLQLNALQGARSAHDGAIANLIAQDVKEKLWAGLLEIEEGAFLSCPSGDSSDARISTIVSEVNSSWAGKLPGVVVELKLSSIAECEYKIFVWWVDGSHGVSQQPNSSVPENSYVMFNYYVRLPGYSFGPGM